MLKQLIGPTQCQQLLNDEGSDATDGTAIFPEYFRKIVSHHALPSH